MLSNLKESFLKSLRRFINSLNFGEKKLYDEETERDEIRKDLQDRLTSTGELINDQTNKALSPTYKENLEEQKSLVEELIKNLDHEKDKAKEYLNRFIIDSKEIKKNHKKRKSTQLENHSEGITNKESLPPRTDHKTQSEINSDKFTAKLQKIRTDNALKSLKPQNSNKRL